VEHPASGGLVLGKKLRLAAAGLTDVGQRRERNQDNTTHHVPTDEAELAEKGALFVVCDGMGGHAAGEVAAELGVNAIRQTYFSSPHTDIISAIADAIKAANERIYQYAREHAEMSGMGTTCVALVLHGGRAYFVNIGDSRAYIVRGGSMRQVTLDHSWVAEQVRAGVLTEDQARTHAHRNVITRSLGTQPNVNADLFIETLREGDRVLLCSDGLHGYVEEREIERELLAGNQPDEEVQTLIDMANTNGGPDNITAIVIDLLEVPPVTDELSLPDATVSEDGAITQPLPIYSAPTVPSEKRVGRPSTRPAALKDAPSPPKRRQQRTRGGRLALAAVRVLALAAMVAIGFSVWDVAYGPISMARTAAAQAQTDISTVRQAIQQAKTQDPAQALTTLAAAQRRLVADLHESQLDSQSIANVRSVLTTELTPAVQNALQRYNTANSITPISATGIQTYGISCPSGSAGASAPLTSVSAFTAVAAPPARPNVPPPGTQTLYAVGGGALYQLVAPLGTISGAAAPGGVTCSAAPLTGVSSVLALSSSGPTLYALVSLTNGSAQVVSVLPNGANADGSPKFKTQALANVPAAAGRTPSQLAVIGNTAYVAFSGGTGGPGILVLVSGARTPPVQISLTQSAASLAVSGSTVYALLADGSLGQAGADHQFKTVTTQVQPPASTEAPDSYYGAAVPTPPATSAASAASVFGTGATLAVDPALPTHVLVGDAAHSRVVRLVASAGGPGLGLSVQYVYGRPLTRTQQLAIASYQSLLNMYLWNGSDLVAFTVSEPTA
jgi:serine/threonine protein phosphatase PrpC